MLKLFPMRHQVSHRRHPLHPSSIRDVRSVLRIRFLKSLNDLPFSLLSPTFPPETPDTKVEVFATQNFNGDNVSAPSIGYEKAPLTTLLN